MEKKTRRDYENFADQCVRGSKPGCTCACPLNLNIREMMEKLQEGYIDAAYKIYRTDAVFPGIVCKICSQPCQKACVRSKLDDPIDMLAVERACVELASSKKPIVFNIPKKNQSVAIIGAGLCGIACAIKLAARGYDVTVYEKTEKMGGSVWDLLPEEEILSELELQLTKCKAKFQMNTEITSLEEISFDAALIATGAKGNRFGLEHIINEKSFATEKEGVFMGGAVLGADPVTAISHGVIASYSIEKFLKVGLMDGMPDSFHVDKSEIEKDLRFVEKADRVIPAGEVYSKEELQAEVGRCLKCDCTLCGDACELFDNYNRWPKRLANEMPMIMFSGRHLAKRASPRPVLTCNQCGLCGQVCPKGINMGEMMKVYRDAMFEEKVMAVTFHEYYLRDLAFAREQGYYCRPAPGGKETRYLFFPGCSLTAGSAEHTVKTYGLLLEQEPATGLFLGCCGAPADWAGNQPLRSEVTEDILAQWEKLGKPAFVFACPTCERQFELYLPQIERVSLYDRIRSQAPGKKLGGTWSVFDPCSSRYDPSMQEAVREMAQAAGAQLEPLPYSGKEAQCCSYGGNTYTAGKGLDLHRISQRTAQSEAPYITYCSNCRDIFARKGKACTHILDVVLGIEEEYVPAHLGKRRENRLLAKSVLAKKYWQEDIPVMENKTYELRIPQELFDRMDAALILEEDIRSVIDHCEATGEKVEDPETGHSFGHLRRGLITYWAEYAPAEGGFALFDAYCHRMEIMGKSATLELTKE